MAILEVQINGSASGLNSALSNAGASLEIFDSKAKKVTESTSKALDAVSGSAAATARSFSLLNNPGFSFGANASKAATTAATALNTVIQSSESAIKSFSLLDNPKFNFASVISSETGKTSNALSGAEQSAISAQKSLALLDKTPFSFGANLNRSLSLSIPSLNSLQKQAAVTSASLGKPLTAGSNSAAFALTNLGRVAQDAPFGFIGIQNNLNPLLESFQRLKAETGSNSSALKALGSSLMGPAGLGIALSLVGAGILFYQKYQQGAKKATEESDNAIKNSKKTLEDYVNSLDQLTQVQVRGASNAQADLTNLRLLYTAYQNANLPLKERKEAYGEIQRLYPDYFKNIKFEQTASESTKKAYDNLTTSILATARARAASDLITKNSTRQLEDEQKMTDLQAQQVKNRAKLSEAQKYAADAGTGPSSTGAGTGNIVAERQLYNARKAVEDVDTQINNLASDRLILTSRNLALEKQVTKEIAKGGKLSGDFKTPPATKGKTVPDKVTPLATASDNAADLAGLIGSDVEVERIRQRYAKLYAAIDTASKKSGADLTALDKQRSEAQANEAKEASVVIIQEQTRVANEIQRIQNESGIQSTDNRDQDLARIQKWYDDQVVKAEGNAAILIAIEQGKTAQIDAVNDKWEAKRIDAQQKVIDKIQSIADKEFQINDNNYSKVSKRIDDELAVRLKAIQEYFDKVRKMYAADPMAQLAIGAAQGAITADVKQKAKAANNPTAEILDKDFKRAVDNFDRDFIGTLSSINQQADKSFKSIFSNLAGSLSHVLDDVFAKQLTSVLTKALSSGASTLSQKQQAIAAGVGMIGGVVSGATKQSSVLGQGAGGALSGAATGAMAGSVIPGLGTVAGGIIGGVVGALGGIFGAGKAKKQEKLQQQQLEESQKQTKLLERQNALAYTSSIIGRMTTPGVVTGIEVNEFGELTTKISGNDLAIVLGRSNSSRQRGT
jgi:hypothetical protein